VEGVGILSDRQGRVMERAFEFGALGIATYWASGCEQYSDEGNWVRLVHHAPPLGGEPPGQ
jgi:hypothetical protein